MLLPILILCVSHLVLASPVQPEYDVEDIEQLKYHFNDFKVTYNKTYTAEEERLRIDYFKENLVKINELNIKNPLAVYGINKFTDWSAEEMNVLLGFGGASLGGGYGSCSVGVATDIEAASAPDAIDWRQKNAVAPVQDQKMCGSCWAFSSAAVLEGAYAVKHKTLLKVSEQQFVDCDPQSRGCDGGWPHCAISINMQEGGQELEADYPYRAKQAHHCKFNKNKAQVKATSCKVYSKIGDKDDKLASLLASAGPLSIAIDASVFELYKEGIITDCMGVGLNHAVLLVGYGEEGGVPYWIVKNSWGVEWGEDGYVRIKKGEGCILIGDYILEVDVA